MKVDKITCGRVCSAAVHIEIHCMAPSYAAIVTVCLMKSTYVGDRILSAFASQFMVLCMYSDTSTTPTQCLPSHSVANAAIPRLARPPQFQPSGSGFRPPAGPMAQSQLQQQAAELSQEQLMQWQAQQLKAYQQRLLEQQLFAQQSMAGQRAAPHYDQEEPASYGIPVQDTRSQEMLMQQMLYQQMYEAALAQQQQQIKSTVSAGAINSVLQQAGDSNGRPQHAVVSNNQFAVTEATQLSAMRRASEGQVHTTSAMSVVVSDVESVVSAGHSIVSHQPQPDVIPTSSAHMTHDDAPSQHHDETFKVPFPPDHVRYYIFEFQL